MRAAVKIGMLGSGFVADFYMDGLRDVPGTEVVANYSRSEERAKEFGQRYGVPRQYLSIEDLCADKEVDLVVIALPNHLHLPAVRAAAAARKAIVCTKPLARNATEAAEMVELVRKAGVMNGYAETEVFSPDVMRARQMIESGAIGKLLTVRAREAHSGPHASHFWDAEMAGGGALLDMGCHTIEAARYFFGKENRIKDVFAWGATLVHHDKTTGEDNAVLLLRLEDGRTSLTEAAWTAKGGMELRNEIYGTMGRIVTDTTSTRIRAFVQESAGYVMEKADADVGWVFPIPDEARVYGYHEEMRHFVGCFVEGKEPRENFVDGYIVNCVLDAAYKSMKSERWEPVQVDSSVAG
ncbi:MAG: Gfo/Idh/MocA family oxidoreductase [Candidatus Dormibacteraeota bacterium]|nr:Gfo/Idh/MocA family oxidoreductase [Candidatus Dormibacteraeota bacterium]